MNILYIEHYAGSPDMGMEFRPYYLAREWIKKGHSVRIVAGDYSHLRLMNPQVEEDFQENVIDGITYTWIKTGAYEGNGIARAKTMFCFVWNLWKRAKWIASTWKPDVIITSSTYPLDTYAGQRIKRKTKNNAILIHEVHDMWPITLIELGGMKRSNPFVMLMQMAENSFCRHSDYIVSLLPAADHYFIKHGMKPEKFKIIMNGVVTSEWENPTPLPQDHQREIDRLRECNKFIICFFGSISRSYAIDYLIEAAEKTNDPRIAIVIVGEGNQKRELIDKAKGCENIIFLPKIPKTSIPKLMEKIDCCYIGALRNDMFRFGICMNKLFDSMMSGKPILYAVEAPNNFIADYKCGISVEAEDVNALVKGMKQMIELPDEERKQMGENGKKAVVDNFSYGVLAEQFAGFFKL